MMWLDYRIKRINKSHPKLWRRKKTGAMKWSVRCPIGAWYRMPIMAEDDLPKEIPDDKYNWWHDNSIVDGVRMGPEVFIKKA